MGLPQARPNYLTLYMHIHYPITLLKKKSEVSLDHCHFHCLCTLHYPTFHNHWRLMDECYNVACILFSCLRGSSNLVRTPKINTWVSIETCECNLSASTLQEQQVAVLTWSNIKHNSHNIRYMKVQSNRQ